MKGNHSHGYALYNVVLLLLYIVFFFRRNWVNVCMVYGCGVFPSMLGQATGLDA